MIEIYITNVQNKTSGKKIKMELLKIHPNLKISFDFEDVDKVLRIEGPNFDAYEIIKTLNTYGFQCEVML